MSIATALIAYIAAASLLTVAPGLDVAIVLRTAAVEGPRRAALAALGVICGCLAWGVAVALGLGILLAASHLAYLILKWAGAAYLAWLGVNLLLRPRTAFDLDAAPGPRGDWWLRGFLTNLLNPKVGVFYVSFLPQFVPKDVEPATFILLLAVIHGLLGAIWFAGLIAATTPLRRWLEKRAVVRWLDRLTGLVFLGFGARLAFDRR
jgi:threonine/homoserine/homoserine lactone efflux protein